MTEATVFVVDDDAAVRDSLEALLVVAGMSVLAFDSAEAFLNSCGDLEWGILLVDVRMPGMTGLALQEELKTRGIDLPVIVMTGHGDVPMAVRAMKQGAIDFLEKPLDLDLLTERIAQALRDRERLDSERRDVEEAARRIANLSEREREVFQLLVEGHPNKVVAHQLSISPRTVEVHRARVMEKMQVRSLSELVRLAFKAEML